MASPVVADPRLPYTASRFRPVRRPTREVRVGGVGIGGKNPIVVQSMVTSATLDIDATVRETIALAEAGCEIVRITAQNVKAAEALAEIRQRVRAAKIEVPLVADIHFLPAAAMEAVKHVDKVRINPGNYADKKKFAVKEYSDSEYESELQRLHEAFSPIVLECKRLGRAMRIGTNHGSLSDRIMNRFGDTPEGMVESALEFIRIADSHGFHDIVLSMKASNPKVMIEAYRLAAARCDAAGFPYPLHVGVTEAGDGEDARIKSAIGIGSLLADGLGDTIRVSLTEDSIYEIPVAQDLAGKAHALWDQFADRTHQTDTLTDGIDPYHYQRRETATISLGHGADIALLEPPRVIILAGHPLAETDKILAAVADTRKRLPDCPIEGLLVRLDDPADTRHLSPLIDAGLTPVIEVADTIAPEDIPALGAPYVVVKKFTDDEGENLREWATSIDGFLAIDANAEALARLAPVLATLDPAKLILTCSTRDSHRHALGTYRAFAAVARELALRAPLWIRGTESFFTEPSDHFRQRLLEHSVLTGGLLCDGLGDMISVETEGPDLYRATGLAYSLLQGARARTTRTEFVACPSCGRTLFNLQDTTRKIRARTGHLKGVTIAVMGCIVNGPGEMADADFGYVGGAPGKVNLYVGKTAVRFNIPEADAVDSLVDLIREHGKWIDPREAEAQEVTENA